MATAISQADDEPTCPICLGLFNVPRQLPCAHTFCQSCLQSYITSKSTEHGKMRSFECPVCRKITGNLKQNTPTGEWASLFPVDTVIQSMLTTKSKVDRVCDACNSDGDSVTATFFCAVCREAMCDNCQKVHRKQKMSKFHTILAIEELMNKPHQVMKFAEGYTCFEHDGENLTYYCNYHKVAGCGNCFFESHKTCSNVRNLKEDLPSLLRETKPGEIMEELKKLEAHLKKFIDLNESSANDLESQVDGLTDQIREMRNKINTVVDELELKVKAEGRRIHKEVVIKTQEENHQCLSLLHAIRNSLALCETVQKYGIDIQKFLIAEKIKSQLPSYYSQVREKYERIETITVQMEFTPLIESMLLLSSTDLGQLLTMAKSTLSIPGLWKRKVEYQIEKAETFNVKVSGGTPCFTSVTILPRDRMILIDKNNSQCILLNNSYEIITNFKLTHTLCDICVVGDNEVAMSMFNWNKIQILSVKDDVISPVRTITTKHKCYGITSAGKGEMVVVGDCGNNKYCWSLIRDEREVKYSDQYDAPSGCYNYIALNNSKTRVYVTVPDTDSLHCSNMEGMKQYTYNPDNLKKPFGVDVDREGNIYVVGCNSHNIHQLSPDGCILRIITTKVPRYPWAISLDNSRDIFIITCYSYPEHQNLHIFRLK